MSSATKLEARITEAVYRGALDADELLRSLEMIAERFGSPGVMLGELDQAHPERQFTIGACIINNEFFSRYQQYAEFDTAPQTLAATKIGTATTTDRMFSTAARRSNIFLNEFLVPLGVNGALASPLLSAEGRFALVAVHQASDRDPFDDEDIDCLERLTPHLIRALQLKRLFLQSEARGKALEAIIDRNETGMVGLGAGGPALFVNSAARQIAAAHDGIALDRGGRIVCADREAAKRMAVLEADVAGGGAGGLVRIPRSSGQSPYVLLVSPLPAGQDLLPNSRSGILFAIHDPSRGGMSADQRLVKLMQIPSGAAKVLQALLEGEDLKLYAERNGISMRTVRFHLSSAFARTGARTQADLVRKSLSIMNDLGPFFPRQK